MTQIVLDDSALKAKLGRVQKAIGSQKMMEGIGLRQLKWVNDNFKSNGNGKWAALRPNTIASRAHGGSVPLQNTGALRKSFDFDVALFGAKVTVGTTNRVAEFHHFGTRPYSIRPKRAKMLRFMTTGGVVLAYGVKHPGLPARPLLMDEREGKTLAIDLIEAFLTAEIKKGG